MTTLSKKQRKMRNRILIAAALLVLVKLLPLTGWVRGLCCLAPYFIIGYDVLRKAALGIVNGQVFDENFLMALATVGAYATGEFDEAVFVMLFYQTGELFQDYAVGKSRTSIAALMDIRPDTANLETENGLETVDPEDVPVGVDAVYAEVLPEDKAAFIRQEKEKGHTVIMVGDGVNDSPALSEADAGIAISTGAAIAREIADITVASEDLFELVTLRKLSEALMDRIHGSYRFIVAFNLSLITLGVAGVLPPAISALLHNTSTLGIGLKNMTDLLEEHERA